MAINTGITILIISIIVCILISDGIDGRRSGGGVRVGSRSRTVRTSRTSRVGSSAWKVALVAGAVYGSTHYMRRRRYRDHPNNEPQFCVNNYKQDVNGTYYRKFICPTRYDPDDFDYCCGEKNRETCCRFFDDPGRTAGVVIGILLVCVITAVCCYCCCFRKTKGSSGTVFSRLTSKNNRQHRPTPTRYEQAMPMKPIQPLQPVPPVQPVQPAPAYDGYTGYPEQSYHPAAQQPGDLPYPMKPPGQPENAPYPANPVPMAPYPMGATPPPPGFYGDPSMAPQPGYPSNMPYPAQPPPPYPQQ